MGEKIVKYEVKELELGGILDYSFRLYKDHFKFIVTVLGVVVIPFMVIWSVVTTAAMPDPNIAPEVLEGMTQQELMAATMPQASALILTFAGAIISIVLSSLAQGALIHGMANRFLGNDVSASDSIRAGLGNVWRIIGTSLLAGIGIGLGMLFCLIPGIYLSLAWYIIIPVLVLEGQPIGAVFHRSTQLMKGHMGKVFVLGFLLLIIGGTAGGFAAVIPGRYPSAILSSLVNALLMGLSSVAALMVYFSARCKTENFDLELLTQAVEGPQEEQDTVL
jgi:hypothetical protein